MSSPPWNDIGVPTQDYTVRRVSTSGSIPLYWGRDTAGRCLLIVELNGDHTREFLREPVQLHGIDVDLREGDEPNQQRLVLTLDRNVDQDVFQSLCDTLIAGLVPVAESGVALSVALAHIRRWKGFFSSRRTRLLSPEEVRGLFAELHFLRALYARRLTRTEAVDAWCGVERAHQDFIFGNSAVEVKSLAGRDRSTIRISSEDQLETVSDNLFLVVHRLSENESSPSAQSLNELIGTLEKEVADAGALEQLSSKLAAFGYVPIAHYDAPRFVVSGRTVYRVEGAFPRLVRSVLPGGIARLSYEIELEALRGFECNENEVLGD